ncbi:MAG: hypothetical protein ABL961_01705 [Vicinamibacterales bacterium]
MKRPWLTLPILLLTVGSLHAQIPAAPPAGTSVEVDPIRCWWRTDAGAVHVGQLFQLSLTCAVLDGDAVQVLPDESRLGPTAIALTPFEVVSGTHPADLRSGARRFFQYHYQIRIINPDAIGKDIALPPVPIHYAINNRVTNSTSVRGRDLVYILPPQPIRIASLVPTDATDIRDAGGEDFSSIESFLYRASLLEMIATTCVVLGMLMIALVLVSLARRSRGKTPAGERVLGARQLVDVAAKELTAIGRERETGGWTDELVARALAATRVTATVALGARVSQRFVPDGTAGGGRLLAPGGLRGQTRVISGSTTPVDIDRAIMGSSPTAAARMPLHQSLRDALAVFAVSQYGREATRDQDALDRALAAAQSAADQVRSEHSWLKSTLRQWRAGGGPPAITRA